MNSMASLWTDPRTQRWFNIGLFLLFVGLSVQYSIKVMTPKRDGRTASAVLRWGPQIQMMEAGEDVHKSHNYPNPPIMAMILWPFSEIAGPPEGTEEWRPVLAALLWFYLKVAMAFICFRWTFKLIETEDKPFPIWAKILAVGLSMRPIMGDLSHGNVNIFILFTVMASLFSFSRGYQLLSGMMLALSIACKVTPALFIGYFLWKRAYRVLVGCSLGLVAFFLVIPSLWFAVLQESLIAGWNQNWQALSSWVETMILPFVVGGFVTPEHNNQSLPGLITRLFTESPSYATYIGDVYVPVQYHNFVDLGANGAKWLIRGFQGLFIFLIIWKCRTTTNRIPTGQIEPKNNWRLSVEFSMILLGMLLFSERTWKHHCVTLLLPFSVLMYGISSHALSRLQRRFLAAMVILATFFIASTSTGLFAEKSIKLHDVVEVGTFVASPAPIFALATEGELTDSIAKSAQVYGAFTFAFLGLLLGLAVYPIRAERKETAERIATDYQRQAA